MDDAALTPPAPAGPALTVAEIVQAAPEALVARMSALADDLHLAYAANTQRAWRAGWRVWVAFCAASEPAWPVLPVTVESLRAFLQVRIAAHKKRATLELNVFTLRMVHRLASLPWPLDTLEGELMWRGIRRDPRVPQYQHQKQPLKIEAIETVLVALNPAVPIDARDGALIPFAYETQLRRSFVVAADLEHVQWEPDGTATVFVPKNKEDQQGKGRYKALTADTARRLRHWIAVAGITEGALWRSVPNRHTSDRFVERLSDRDVARIFKRRAKAAGIESAEIAGHSTRIGAAQDMLAAGFRNAEIMQQVGWRSEKQLFRYTERLEAKQGAMARFLQKRARAAGGEG